VSLVLQRTQVLLVIYTGQSGIKGPSGQSGIQGPTGPEGTVEPLKIVRLSTTSSTSSHAFGDFVEWDQVDINDSYTINGTTTKITLVKNTRYEIAAGAVIADFVANSNAVWAVSDGTTTYASLELKSGDTSSIAGTLGSTVCFVDVGASDIEVGLRYVSGTQSEIEKFSYFTVKTISAIQGKTGPTGPSAVVGLPNYKQNEGSFGTLYTTNTAPNYYCVGFVDVTVGNGPLLLSAYSDVVSDDGTSDAIWQGVLQIFKSDSSFPNLNDSVDTSISSVTAVSNRVQSEGRRDINDCVSITHIDETPSPGLYRYWLGLSEINSNSVRMGERSACVINCVELLNIKGDTGTTGLPGFAANTGSTGQSGVQGPTGTRGATGPSYLPFSGATGGGSGTIGLVPRPNGSEQNHNLFGDSTWKLNSDVVWLYGTTVQSWQPMDGAPTVSGLVLSTLAGDSFYSTDLNLHRVVVVNGENQNGYVNWPQPAQYTNFEYRVQFRVTGGALSAEHIWFFANGDQTSSGDESATNGYSYTIDYYNGGTNVYDSALYVNNSIQGVKNMYIDTKNAWNTFIMTKLNDVIDIKILTAAGDHRDSFTVAGVSGATTRFGVGARTGGISLSLDVRSYEIRSFD
jgi:hypothetical protein